MKICHESFVDDNINDKHNQYIEPLDKFELDKSDDYKYKKIIRDKNNNCETNKALRDVSELMFFDKNNYSDIYDLANVKNRDYKNNLCFW